MIYYIIFSYLLMLGMKSENGCGWLDVILAPLSFPYSIGRFMVQLIRK